MDWLGELQFWHWWIAAMVLITLEMMVLPAVYFLWMGISAGLECPLPAHGSGGLACMEKA